MGCSRARCILSAAAWLAGCDQDMGTGIPGGDTPGEVPWSDAPLKEFVSKEAPGRKPCTAQMHPHLDSLVASVRPGSIVMRQICDACQQHHEAVG